MTSASVQTCPHCEATLEAATEICPRCHTPPKNPKLVEKPDPLLGQVIGGKYKIIQKIGAGGFGAVYEAKHTRLDSKVAIKTLHSEALKETLVVERFRREALATSRLQSPYTVKIFDRGGTEDGTLWLAMEFIEGQTLEELLQQKKRLSEDELLPILFPICEALTEAHEKGIVHRDLKPQNIMLMQTTSGLSPKLLDFGIAGLRESDANVTSTGMVSGTPKYMAPEQWEGLKKTDARTDIYALGMISYQCLAGALPFFADNPLGWMKLHSMTAPRPLGDLVAVSEPVRSAIMCAIAKEPSARPQTIQELRAMLEGQKKAPLTLTPIISTPELAATANLSSPIGSDPTKAHALPTKKSKLPIFLVLIFFGVLAAGYGAISLFSEEEKPTPPQTTPASQSLPVPVTSTSTAIPTHTLSEIERACLEAKDVDDAFQKCQLATQEPNISQETKKKSETSTQSFLQKYLAIAKDGIASEKESGLSQAKEALQRLSPLSENKEVQEAQRSLKEAQATLEKRSLWKKIKENPNQKEACKDLGRYFKMKLSPEERTAALALRDKAFSDAVAFEACQD